MSRVVSTVSTDAVELVALPVGGADELAHVFTLPVDTGHVGVGNVGVGNVDAGHLDAGHLDGETVRLAARLEREFLAGAGWDPVLRVLEVPPDHRLLGWRQCRARGCVGRASGPEQVCLGCRRRLAEHGLAPGDLEAMPERGWSRADQCRVGGCEREWRTPQLPLCRAHLYQQRHSLRLPLEEFLADPRVTPLPACGPCAVTACVRDRDGVTGVYCRVHQGRFAAARKKDPDLDERHWRATMPAVARPGLVSLRGLPPGLVVQVLFGLQERTRAERRTDHKLLRTVCDDLRRQQVGRLGDFTPMLGQQALVNSFAAHLERAFTSVETEQTKDVWDLSVFGHSGLVTFTKISQEWLKQAAKRWVLEELPRRRGKAVGATLGTYVVSAARLSESLRLRADGGHLPSELGRRDIENFLNRLAYQHSIGQVSLLLRERILRNLRQMFEQFRALGLTRPGQVAASLGDDFMVLASDIPHPAEPGEPSRDLPAEIVRQLCDHLDELEAITSRRMRVAVELLIDTGRRPNEICTLPFDCLDHDGDGAPVLVYDNNKSGRLGRRLPISQATASLITGQQAQTRDRFAHTPPAELKLLPSLFANPDGRRGIRVESLSERHRTWVDTLPPLLRADGGEYDKSKVTLYAYRHTYAQRHADAGVPVDVLRELMDHRLLDATRKYYRVGEKRRREAVDRLAALQFDRHGNRIWAHAQQLLDTEHVRRSVGQVAVPFGVCAEPSNVQAGGHACPFRFRCAGCDHFRTDASYLPDLQAYLDDLLRSRERLRAATELDQWARADAMPADEEITRIRRLISRLRADLDDLTPEERAHVDQAVATVRRHRGVMLGMPRRRQILPDIRPQQGTA